MRAFRAWRVIVPERVSGKLVDLRIREERKRYHMTEAQLQADPAPESGKILARRARNEGRTGIIYGSVRNRPSGVCVAIFLESAEAELSVESAAQEWARFIEGRGRAS
jgi:hypothetical protein